MRLVLLLLALFTATLPAAGQTPLPRGTLLEYLSRSLDADSGLTAAERADLVGNHSGVDADHSVFERFRDARRAANARPPSVSKASVSCQGRGAAP